VVEPEDNVAQRRRWMSHKT